MFQINNYLKLYVNIYSKKQWRLTTHKNDIKRQKFHNIIHKFFIRNVPSHVSLIVDLSFN